MNEYHKIQTVFKRDPATKHRTLIEGEYALPVFEYLAQAEWVFTEKVDGTNVRIETGYGRETVTFKGRTERAQMPTFLLAHLQDTFTPDGLHEVFPVSDSDEGDPTVTLYGEGYGARIQKGGGGYLADRVGFILFDVRVGRWWLERDAVEDVAEKLGCPVVPVLGSGTLKDAVDMAHDGFTSFVAEGEGREAEGLVLRPHVELCDRGGRRVIAKIKHKDFVAGPKA